MHVSSEIPTAIPMFLGSVTWVTVLPVWPVEILVLPCIEAEAVDENTHQKVMRQDCLNIYNT